MKTTDNEIAYMKGSDTDSIKAIKKRLMALKRAGTLDQKEGGRYLQAVNDELKLRKASAGSQTNSN